MIQRIRASVWLAAALALSASSSSAEQPRLAEDEDSVKVAVIVKLIHFVTWPNAAVPSEGKAMTICVLSKDRWLPLLRQTVQGESFHHQPIAVARITQAREAGGCQVLIVGRAIERQSIEMWDNWHVLTISDERPSGLTAMVNLSVSSGRTRFRLNLEHADRASVKFSAKLLQLADVVSQGAE